jgi:two-component system response regulator NreC
VLDIGLPEPGGIAVARDILKRHPQQRLLFLTMHLTEVYVADGLGTGALGYAGKDQPIAEVIAAIRTVGSGQSYLAPRIAHFVVDGFARLRQGGRAASVHLDVLSQREREVFDLLVQGRSNKAISGKLGISLRTVETHRVHVLRKLRVHSMFELLQFAARHEPLRFDRSESRAPSLESTHATQEQTQRATTQLKPH